MQQPDPGSKSDAVDSTDSSQPVQTTQSTPSDEIKYLLVDDNRINIKILSTLMNKLGLQYQIATNGQEAIDAYKMNPEKCRLIFMDISMPVVDGLLASRTIRSYEHENGLPPAVIVGLTASTQDADSQRLISKNGMDTFLRKPIRFDPLKSIIESQPV